LFALRRSLQALTATPSILFEQLPRRIGYGTHAGAPTDDNKS